MPEQLAKSLDVLTLNSQQEILVSTPYFIPDEVFYKFAPELISTGVRVVILTNSLGSTNHPIVHSAYKKHRKRVIEMGVALFETRHDAAVREDFDTPPVVSQAFGLHAKVVVIDRMTTFVSTLNWDPRSIYLNTELGLIIDSPALAEAVANDIEGALEPENSWQVKIDSKNRLIWVSEDTVLQKEPARTFWQRFQAGFFRRKTSPSQILTFKSEFRIPQSDIQHVYSIGFDCAIQDAALRSLIPSISNPNWDESVKIAK